MGRPWCLLHPCLGREAKAAAGGLGSPRSWAQLPGPAGPSSAITCSNQLSWETLFMLGLRRGASHQAPGTVLNLSSLSSAL